MDSDYFFYEQCRHRPFQKRFRKLPEDLPDSLKANLNPKVAAYFANKEKQRQDEDIFGDGKKTLMPEISQVFNALKNHLDSSLCNDEDSQRYIFEEAKNNAGHILFQLSRIIYYYDNIASLIPKSLECQMMVGYCELTADIQIIPREWQTQASKEAYFKKISDTLNGEDPDKASPSIMEEGRSTRSHSIVSESGKGNKKKLFTKSGTGLPEIYEDGETMSIYGNQNVKRSDSRLSGMSKRSSRPRLSDFRGSSSLASKSPALKQGYNDFEFLSALTEAASETRSSSIANPSNLMSVLQFQLSSKLCQEKGWIVHKGKEDQLAKEAILEYCVQRLHLQLKLIKEQKAHETHIGHNTTVAVRYYGDTHKETVLKYRKSPMKVSSFILVKNGKPRIPRLLDDQNEGKQLMLTTHPDGTTIVYYPSGHPAIVASAAGINRPGFYTIVYNDDAERKMLAAFTPNGRGACYHMNGHIRFLTTNKGGHIANKDGKVIRHWKWPQAPVKLTSPVQFQMNQHIGLRCVAENYIVIVYSCQKESTRLFVNMTPQSKERRQDEHQEHLLSNVTFTSKSAKSILRKTGTKSKSKAKKKKEKLSKQLAELVRSVDNQDKLLYELEADKDLARLQRKARILVDDWLEHYRITIGLKSPTLEKLRETPRKSRVGAYSAKITESREDRKNTFGFSLISARVPSAPTTTIMKPIDTPVDNEPCAPANPTTVRFEPNVILNERNTEEEIKTLTPGLSNKLVQILQSGPRIKSAGSKTKSSALSRQPTAASILEKEITVGNITLCPLALRTMMLSDPKPQCRCSRHTIPFISDVEYDRYIQEEAPENQIQIIAVVSSVYPQSNHSESMLCEIYQDQNRNRTRPCLQCRTDSFRILKYDINTAMEGSDHAQPILLSRHNVVPGMFLIYCEGRLLFCDHIFNGYGNARKDFQKQVLKSRLDFNHGISLPKDFRFSPLKGPQGPRSPWGGEIGGAGVDHFGSPGTTQSENVTNNTAGDLTQIQADKMRAVYKYIGEILSLQQQQQSPQERQLDMVKYLGMSLSSTESYIHKQPCLQISHYLPDMHTAPPSLSETINR